MALESERSRVAHLLRRAGFGATETELDQYTALGFQGALERLLNPESVDDRPADQPVPFSLDPTSRETRRQIEPAKFWWFSRMLATQRPLREKMALFWHTHFATANSKVANAPLMVDQIQLFRDAGLGSFEMLLQQVTRDPAMLVWLDNRQNRKGVPNENYAREVMELFTVGIGNYSEQDVKEGARAFTGHTLDRSLQYSFNRNQHDAGSKTFMGQTGAFDADDILGILVRHPATARFISTKLFHFFVHDNPDPATIDRLAGAFTSGAFASAAPPYTAVDIVDAPRPQPRWGYAPGTLRVQSGSWLTWSNAGNDAHTVTAVDGAFDSGELNPSEGFSWYFDAPGTYQYVCTLHPWMQGKVIVDDAASGRQRLVQVFNQVSGILDAGGQPYHVVADAALASLRGC